MRSRSRSPRASPPGEHQVILRSFDRTQQFEGEEPRSGFHRSKPGAEAFFQRLPVCLGDRQQVDGDESQGFSRLHRIRKDFQGA